MTTKKTERELRTKMYNDILTQNKAMFKAGSTISRQNFATMFNIEGVVHSGSYKKVQKSNFLLIQAQAEINTLMRENGLRLSSKGYYSEFYVKNKKATKTTIERLSGKADTVINTTNRFQTALVNRIDAGTWGRYNRVTPAMRNRNESETVDETRHNNVKARLQQV